MSNGFDQLVGFIWNIANKLRGPYKPPQYRLVMLPMTVLRRMDCVLEPSKDQVLEQYEKLNAQGHSEEAIHKILGKYAAQGRQQAFYNTSKYTFKKLLGDPDNIAQNLVTYINGLSQKAKEIFEKFEFEQQIEKLDKANRLFLVVKEFADLNLHPDHVDNLQMGYVFEELVRKFNEQANEEAGDHFTPREVIRLMAHLVYTSDEDVYTPGIARTIYDPTCGTGGMLSVSEEYIREQNPQANLLLYGQEYNPESYAICCSDLLIKDEPVDHIIFGDTLGDGKTSDGHPDKRFHYMLANPPFGVEWKTQQGVVEKEYKQYGFKGRFGPGTPRINDGALLFLLHMMSKMHPAPEEGGEGSKIAIVFNGSPLFTGDAGSGESNIRRWIIENDYLDAIIALPDQMFYNTGIYTYIWLVSNRKRPERKGRVQLIDATRHFLRMGKSLGEKRNELTEEHINEITRLYARFVHDDNSKIKMNNLGENRICSKVFDNAEFGYLKITVERPLRLNFQVCEERIARLKSHPSFIDLSKSKKRKNTSEIEEDVSSGRFLQQAILTVLESMDASFIYKNRDDFIAELTRAFKESNLKLNAAVKKIIINSLSERDKNAEICLDSRGNPEADSELQDYELVPLPRNISLPLPIGYEGNADNSQLVKLTREHCEKYVKTKVLPYNPDAWIDHNKTKIGYEIPHRKNFSVFRKIDDLKHIESDILNLEKQILQIFKEIRI